MGLPTIPRMLTPQPKVPTCGGGAPSLHSRCEQAQKHQVASTLQQGSSQASWMQRPQRPTPRSCNPAGKVGAVADSLMGTPGASISPGTLEVPHRKDEVSSLGPSLPSQGTRQSPGLQLWRARGNSSAGPWAALAGYNRHFMSGEVFPGAPMPKATAGGGASQETQAVQKEAGA